MPRPVRRDLASRRAELATAAALVTILAGAAVVRLIGIDSGRPFAYHPDEWIVFKPAMTMVHERDWNPHVFWYSSLLIDLQAIVTAALRQFGGSSIETGQAWIFDSELLPQQFRYLMGGRLLVLGLGLATIVVAFGIGRVLRGTAAGLIAAALLAAMPLHISDSRYLTTDVPAALFCALTLFLTVKADADDRERWWLLAGVAAGLAASTKWNGIIVLVVPLLAYLLAAGDVRGLAARLRRRTPYLIVVAAVLALVVTTPAILLDTSTVAEFFRLQAGIYAQPRIGIPSDSLALNLRGLAAGLGPVTTVVAGLGLARFALRPRRRVELTIPAFALVTIVLVSLPARQFDRNMIPILPFLAIAAGCLLADLPGMLRSIRRRRTGSGEARAVSRIGVGVTVLVLAGCLTAGVVAGVTSVERASEVDTRTIAREWILANVARNTVIARERETPVLTPEEYRLRPRSYLSERSLDWYRDAGTQLLVSSSYAYNRFVGNASTPEPDAWYRAAFGLPEVFRVDPAPGRPGPTIRILQLAPFTRAAGAAGG